MFLLQKLIYWLFFGELVPYDDPLLILDIPIVLFNMMTTGITKTKSHTIKNLTHITVVCILTYRYNTNSKREIQ